MLELLPPQESVIKILGASLKTSKDSYIWSIYLFHIEDEGERYLFHNLTKLCLKLEDGDVLPLERKSFSIGEIESDKLLKELKDNFFLVPEGFDETKAYMSIFRVLRLKSTHKKGLRQYTILPTTACNARCFYCYEKDFVPVTMTDETVSQVIKFIKETHNKEETIKLNWFGGEPLVGVGIIDRICTELKEAGIPYQSSMVTNGILIDDYVAGQMKGLWNLYKIQISLDGIESEYNRRKNYIKHYDSAYQTVMENIGRLAGSNIRVSLRANGDIDNADTMPQFVDDVYKRFGSYDNIYLYFASLYQDFHSSDSLVIREKLAESMRYANKLFRRNKEVKSESKSKKLYLRINQCMADDACNNTVITPDGLLYKCEHIVPGTSYGNIWDGVTDKEFINKLLIPTTVPERCYGCPALPNCTPFDQCPIKYIPNCREIFTEGASEQVRNCIHGIEEDAGC